MQQPEVRNIGSADKRFVRHLLWAEEGPTAVEYAVMLALIMLACIAVVQALTTETAGSFNSSSNAIETAISG